MKNENKRSYKSVVLKCFIGFLILMVALTVFSRVADSLTIATIDIQKATKKNLVHTVSINGTIEPNNEIKIKSEKGFYIQDIHVKEGMNISAGDKLITLDGNDLENKIFDTETAIKKLELQLQQLGLSENTSIPSKEIELEKAKQAPELIETNFILQEARAVEDLNFSKEAVNKAYSRLSIMKEKDEAKQLKEAQEAVEKEQEAVKKAQQALEEQEYQKEKALKEYQFGIDDAQLEIEDIENNMEAFAQDKLKRAKEKYKTTESDWSQKVMDTYDGITSDYNTFEDIQEKYNKAVEKGDEESIAVLKQQLKDSERIYNDSGSKINDINKKKEEALNEAQKAVNDAKTELDVTLESQKTKAEANLQRAEDKYDLSEKDWDRKIETAKEDIKTAESDTKMAIETLEKIRNGGFDDSSISSAEQAIEALTQTIISNERALEDVLNQKDKQLTEANEKISDIELEIQKEGEAISAQSQKNDIQTNTLLLDMSTQRRNLKNLKEIYGKGGIIVAPKDGIILSIDTEVGANTLGQSLITMAETGTGYCLKAIIDSEQAKYVQIGDNAEVTLSGESTPIKQNKVESLKKLKGEDSGKTEVTIVLSEGIGEIGMSAFVKIVKQTEVYRTVIPINALKKSSNGDYVLITVENNTILGQQLVAQKVLVVEIERDNSNVAVTASLDTSNQIITNSSKPIIEGDRVRLNVQ